MNTERWYIAVVVVASEVEGESATDALVDLQFRLIRAADDEQAYQLAVEIGSQQQHSYHNEAGALVSWRYAGLHDLRELNDREPAHGIEVYSQLTRRAASELLVAKEQLTCFWAERNRDRTAREILGD